MKYSEDGKCTFTKKDDGTYEWHLVQDEVMGASPDDIANWIASATGDFTNFFIAYRPEAAKMILEIRLEQSSKTRGGIF